VKKGPQKFESLGLHVLLCHSGHRRAASVVSQTQSRKVRARAPISSETRYACSPPNAPPGRPRHGPSLIHTWPRSLHTQLSMAPLDSPLCCVGGCGQLTRNNRPHRPAAGALSTYRPPPRAPLSPTQPSVARQHLRCFLPLAGQHTHAACGQHHSKTIHTPLRRIRR